MVVNNYLEQGFLIFVSHQYEPMPSNPIVVEPGSHAYISMSATVQTYVDSTYPMFDLPCRTNTTLHYVKGTAVMLRKTSKAREFKF